MKLRREIARNLLLLLLLTCANGCVTNALWENSRLEAQNEPANNPNLHLFQAKQQNDLLVVYDEYSERHDSTQTRAYWLNENQKLVEARRRPRFVSTNAACRLTAVPVLSSSTNGIEPRPAFYALAETNQQSFALYSDTRQINSYMLPFYDDGMGKVEKIVLTPPAATADLTIIGGVLGYWCLEGLASSGYNSAY